MVMKRSVAAAAMFVAMLAGARSAFACDCIGLETKDYLRIADIVYTGQVVAIRPDARRPEIEFRLDRGIKGTTDDRFVLATPPARGVDCRGFDFVVGKRYLVFATARDSAASAPGGYGVNWCGGTVSLETGDGQARLRETLDAAQKRSLDIYVVDVEGGNATLVVAPFGESLLIDTGNLNGAARDADRIMAAVKDAGVRQIDHLIITHWHGDHFGGVAELAKRIPIRHFIDHGANVQPNPTVDEFLQTTYPMLYRGSTHTVAKAGDKIDIAGLDVRVAGSAGQVIAAPLPGAGGSNPYCASFKPGENNAEDPQSVVTHITFGKFRALHPGDLTKNKEFELMCPRNRIGAVDVLLGLHHGQDTSNSEVLVHALHPRVAIMNNGTRKGGQPDVMKIVHSSPGLEDLWQLHFSVLSGQEYTVPGVFIANGVDEQPTALPIAPAPLPQPADNAPPPPAHNGPAYWIKVSAREDGSFTVTNSRNGFSKKYQSSDRR